MVEAENPWDAVADWELTSQGKPLSEQTMRAIARVYAQLRSEQKRVGRGRRSLAWAETCNLFGISNGTLNKIVRSIKKTGSVPKVSTKRPRAAPQLNSLDETQLLQVRCWIYQAAIDGKPYFLSSIVKDVEEKFKIKISKTTMGRILRVKLALRFCKIRSHGTKVENERILFLLKNYLSKLDALKPQIASGKVMLVFTDESYIHPSHAIRRYWYHIEDDDRVFGSPKGRGRRIILVNFGCKEGWIEGGEYVWECTGKETSENGDYHGNVNGEWWTNMFEKVCQQLQARKKKCVFIMDNAKYHKLVGNPELDAKYWPDRGLSGALKDQVMKYLKDHDIPHPKNILAPEAKKLARQHYQKDGLRSVQIARKYGHDILFTPPYWPQLQPIETAWGMVKNYVANNRTGDDYSVAKTLPLVRAGFKSVTPEQWQKMINDAIEYGEGIKKEIAKREQLEALTPEAADDTDDENDSSTYSDDEEDMDVDQF